MKIGRGVFSGEVRRFIFMDGKYLDAGNSSEDLLVSPEIPDENLGKPEYLLPPVEKTGQIRDFYAFEEHAANSRKNRGLEMEPEWYNIPVYYYTSNSSLYGSMQEITYPSFSSAMDLEVEVGIIIGKDGKNISKEDALSYIYGLTLMNDWSARDLWRKEARLNLGPSKSKDFATSIGPYITTIDEIEHLWNGHSFKINVKSFINGMKFSDSGLDEIYWSIGKIISYASMDSNIRKGDIIMTGTFPGGCIFEKYREGMHWLGKGDTVTIKSDVLGELRNEVI